MLFSQDSFSEPDPETARTYMVSSDNKAFQPNMGGYSIFASSIDGSDHMVRLDSYMAKYRYPEKFFRINDEIEAIPYKPNNKVFERKGDRADSHDGMRAYEVN